MEALASEILHNYGTGRVVVGVDGRSGAGTAEFADALAEAIAGQGHIAFRASIGDVTPEGGDVGGEALRATLIEPFRANRLGEAELREYAPAEREPATPADEGGSGTGDTLPHAVLILDGPRLQRSELRSAFSFSAWVETPEDSGDVDDDRYIAAETPSAIATAIYDNSDPEHPRRIFADSC